MTESVSALRQRYERRVGRRDVLREQFAQAGGSLRRQQRAARIAERALDVVRVVALETQEQLEFHIASVVSAAQEAVFGSTAYTMRVTFAERRGKTECDMMFERDGQLYDPLSSSGYGAVDVAAFALRAACWSMGRSQVPAMLLDEPFRHLKGAAANRRAVHMVKQVSAELGIQVIMVSDERAPIEDIREGADRVFRVSLRDGVSECQAVG